MSMGNRLLNKVQLEPGQTSTKNSITLYDRNVYNAGKSGC
jgi:hypothetical protein